MIEDNQWFSYADIQLDPILQYLIPNPNLPDHLRHIANVLARTAADMLVEVPRSAERTTGFRKLLEAKDCFVRAALPD